MVLKFKIQGIMNIDIEELKELVEKLEIAYGCLIGSHTGNTTAEQQFKPIIKELKKQIKQSLSDQSEVVTEKEINKIVKEAMDKSEKQSKVFDKMTEINPKDL
ncbi:hypothetical protein LCGC14_0246320 [marine sediment metagenome]|uniref:Uncharacterized protein n=1 Tax=marine sediment metagenome TaxID=412755 RepID=A0A0F9WR70_9ZZZZ